MAAEPDQSTHDGAAVAGTVAADASRDRIPARPAWRAELSDEVSVYEPYRFGLPPLRRYLRDAWRRRDFATELSRTSLHAQHFDTAFGQLWLLLNPLLLALIYFLLVDLLRAGQQGSGYFAHLMAGLFAFQLVGGAVTQAAKSVVAGQRLILNTAFPRTLLPLSSVITAIKRFLPSVLIYAPVHIAAGLPVGPALLWLVPVAVLLALFACGAALLAAAAQVYVRDLSSFLPYLLRLWLYGSPVLYYFSDLSQRSKAILAINPLTPLLASLSDILQNGAAPSVAVMALGVAWTAVTFLGGTLFFISRERDFAVRL